MQLRALPLFMRWAISRRIRWFAAVLGAVVISAEVLLLRSIGKWLGRYPSVRNASDNIRNAMNMLMEVALLVGSIFRSN
ncbi:inner membrane protein [Escherichia coli]|nr:inner membrane protein [Escherichia coli]